MLKFMYISLMQLKKPTYLSALALLLTFEILASIYSLTVPSFEAPDEIGHFRYIVHIITTRTLPIQQLDKRGEDHQPPLYYVIAAIAALPADLTDQTGSLNILRPNPHFIWTGGGYDVNVRLHNSAETFPYQGHALALRLARGISILMGTVTVGLTMMIGWKVFPDCPSIGLLAAALVAFNPQFLFISGVINNDNLVILATTGACWQILRAVEQPERWWQWLCVGVWVAVAILAKLNGLAIGVVVVPALVLGLLYVFQQWPSELFVRNALAFILPVILITGWWFVRNLMLYGDLWGWIMYR